MEQIALVFFSSSCSFFPSFWRETNRQTGRTFLVPLPNLDQGCFPSMVKVLQSLLTFFCCTDSCKMITVLRRDVMSR